jgi:ubiquinone/menaquinone biosynthesis C-methylase UbiE
VGCVFQVAASIIDIVDPTVRFTDRVENYVKARPGYPPEIVGLLEKKCGLTRTSVLTDVGCGTGLLAKLFCEYGCRTIGVEPNAAMRQAGQDFLGAYPNFEIVEGTAEAIPLPGTSVDFITAGQAFHWFNQKEARHEFMRILKPNGWAVLVWNDREYEGSKFADAYEALLWKFGIDYEQVHHRGKSTVAALQQFFGNSAFAKESFPNVQHLDYDGLVARVLSASYMPSVDHTKYRAMMEEVERIFRDNQKDGVVAVKYETNVHYGQMS